MLTLRAASRICCLAPSCCWHGLQTLDSLRLVVPCLEVSQLWYPCSCREALQTGLEASGSKRKQPEGGGGAAAAVAAGRPSAKRGMLDSMLGDLSSSEEEEEEEAE